MYRTRKHTQPSSQPLITRPCLGRPSRSLLRHMLHAMYLHSHAVRSPALFIAHQRRFCVSLRRQSLISEVSVQVLGWLRAAALATTAFIVSSTSSAWNRGFRPVSQIFADMCTQKWNLGVGVHKVAYKAAPFLAHCRVETASCAGILGPFLAVILYQVCSCSATDPSVRATWSSASAPCSRPCTRSLANRKSSLLSRAFAFTVAPWPLLSPRRFDKPTLASFAVCTRRLFACSSHHAV